MLYAKKTKLLCSFIIICLLTVSLFSSMATLKRIEKQEEQLRKIELTLEELKEQKKNPEYRLELKPVPPIH